LRRRRVKVPKKRRHRTITLPPKRELQWLNGKHRGQRGFVIGGGPSILDIQNRGFNFQALTREVTVGVNKAYNLFTPTYLVWTDSYFWRNFNREVSALKCLKFCPFNVAKKFAIDANDVLIVKRDPDKNRRAIIDSFVDPLPMWNNSGVTGIRVAYALGLSPIYLVGMDVLFKDHKDRTHFHTDYDASRIVKTKPHRYDLFLQAFHATIQAVQSNGVEVYSCSECSRLNDFIPFVDITTLF